MSPEKISPQKSTFQHLKTESIYSSERNLLTPSRQAESRLSVHSARSSARGSHRAKREKVTYFDWARMASLSEILVKIDKAKSFADCL